MTERVLSLAEIAEIERAYKHGAPTLGHAASGLLRRWRFPLRDSETFLRLVFLAWYSEHEPTWLTGLGEPELPSVDQLIVEHGGEESLPGEALFTLAVLWHLFPPLGADEEAYRRRAQAFGERSASLESGSPLFHEWRFFLDDAEDTERPRIYVEPELHARYHGRGAMGEYLEHTLLSTLRQGR